MPQLLAEADRMAAAAAKAGKQLMVGHLIRYHDAFRELESQIEAGVIGEVRHVTATGWRWAVFAPPSQLSMIYAARHLANWRSWADAGGSDVPRQPCDARKVDTLGFLAFAGGRSAAMTASWMSLTRNTG